MKIYPNKYWLEEFEVHSQDDVNYYHYEVVGRELFTWKFAKKTAYIVGPSNLHCIECGMKYGSNGCKYCKPWIQIGTWWDGSPKGHGINIEPNKLQENNLYIGQRVNGLYNDNYPNKWKEFHKEYKEDSKILIRYICHNCKYFMYHHINYCYKCGQKLQRSADTYGAFEKQCEGYRSGF